MIEPPQQAALPQHYDNETVDQMSVSDIPARECAVANFRSPIGLKNFYRSAAPDDLADLLDACSQKLFDAERLILYDVTMIVDLRSPVEGDEMKRKAISQRAQGGGFEFVSELEDISKSDSRRQILIPTDCVLTKQVYLDYVIKKWVSVKNFEEISEESRDELVYCAVNKHGLNGLVEAVLETKVFVSTVLKAITLHLERTSGGKVLIHCSTGKDRAGVICMLCQSLVGVTDEEIAEDFAKSSCIRAMSERVFKEIFRGKVETDNFCHANPETIHATIFYLRNEYGSVEKYLDSIGFDESWRNRFVQAVGDNTTVFAEPMLPTR